MSKSLRRVQRALAEAGLPDTTREMPDDTRTAALAAAAVGCTLDQIAKSILFQGVGSGLCVLFITAGGRQVDPEQAALLAGEALGKADAAFVRAQTGFAIGGVSPLGHLTPPRAFFDRRLLDFDTVWAAAGTPRHVFSAPPALLLTVSGATEAAFSHEP